VTDEAMTLGFWTQAQALVGKRRVYTDPEDIVQEMVAYYLENPQTTVLQAYGRAWDRVDPRHQRGTTRARHSTYAVYGFETQKTLDARAQHVELYCELAALRDHARRIALILYALYGFYQADIGRLFRIKKAHVSNILAGRHTLGSAPQSHAYRRPHDP
jgi:hypothetical protein